MGRWILVDSSALVGLFLEGDEWHRPAVRVLDDLRRERYRMLSTTDVFDEVVTAIRKWAGHARAVQVGEILRRSALVRMVPVDDETREEGWKRFVKLKYPGLSLTDCTSFAVMDKYGISEAFTFDGDFRKAGYATRPSKE